MLRNWKTTVFGFAAGVLNLIANGVSIKQALLSAGLAALGLVGKDHDVSGTS